MSDPKKTPAFPQNTAVQTAGMTLRDFMAIHATEEDLKMQAALIRDASPLGILPDDWRTTARYMHADSMLKARDA